MGERDRYRLSVEHGNFVPDLAVVLGVAAVTGVVFRWLKQPSILGYLCAGLIVGPEIPVPVFANPHRVEALSEFGVALVMFNVGLEFRIARFIRVLPTSGLTALVQISTLLWLGETLGSLLGWRSVESLFLGACMCISSTMVVSKVYDQHRVKPDVRQLVFGVLIIQDLVAIGLITTMTALAAGSGLSLGELSLTAVQLAGVLLALVAFGMLVVPRALRAVVRMADREILVVFATALCFTTALLAQKLGYSIALGAFIAGLLTAESGERKVVEHMIRPLKDVFAAVFFVSIGMTVNPHQAWAQLDASLWVFFAVVAGQMCSVSFAAAMSGSGLRTAVTAGASLGQIGEFAFILAAIGTSAGVVRPELQAVVVTVAILSAFSTPLLLRLAPRLASVVDRFLPERFRSMLSIYEAWWERMRAAPDPQRARASALRSAVRALALDATVLLALGLVMLLGLDALAGRLRTHVMLSRETARLSIMIGMAVAGLPFVLGASRNAARIVSSLADAALRDSGANVSPERLAGAHRLIHAGVYFLVVAGVGFPAVALVRPWLSGPYAVPFLLLALLAVGVYGYYAAGAVERDARSGALELLNIFAQHSAAESLPIGDYDPMPNLYRVRGVRLAGEDYAVGRTLGELNLRALTGATVIALHRAAGDVELPTGSEKLQAGDVLAVTGPADATAQAWQLLRRGKVRAERGRRPSESGTHSGPVDAARG